MKATDIIKNLINLVGFTAGIIIVSIGAILLMNSFLKVYIFGIENDSYSVNNIKWQCEKYDWETQKSNYISFKSPESPVYKEPSAEEKLALEKKYDECILEEEEKSKKAYKMKNKSSMADGIAFLIVGLPILLFFNRRK